MAAATTVEDEAVLLEAGAKSGGLCRSFPVGASGLDVGGHAFFISEARSMI